MRTSESRGLNVVAVVPLYPPHSRVGAWLATHEWLKGLADRGHKVHVISQLHEGDPYEYEGLRVSARTKNAMKLFPWADVVISHLGDNSFGARLALQYGKKSVRIAHSVPHDSARRMGPASLLVANSRATLEATDWKHRDRKAVVCHPITWPEEVWVPETGNAVTLVNLSPDKGGELFWELARRMPDVEFLGVRGGYGRQVEGDLPNVRVFETQPDMRKVFQETRLLIMPSKFESWGMAGVEAMVSGIPVIAHPTPGLMESLGTAGVFVDRDEPDLWEQVIRTLLEPGRWELASELAWERAQEIDPQKSLDDFCRAVEALV